MEKLKAKLVGAKQRLLLGQTLALLAGSIIGWREVVSEINYFCDSNGVGIGGLLSFSGNVTTNPVLTPCFWGSIAFVIALTWSVYIFWADSDKLKLRHENNLFKLLIASTIFAWANTAYTFYKYYTATNGSDYFGCPANKLDNPWTSACFMGASAFLIALLLAIAWRRNESED